MKTTLYRTATEEDRLETQKLVSETGRRCLAVEADVRDRPAMKAFVARTIDELGPIDIVLANAGITAFAPAWETPYEMWDETIDICLNGVWNTCREVMPSMVERRKGTIVITSSNAGLIPIPNVAPYVAAKHGITGLMKVLAVELAPFDIRVNAVHPCGVATDLVLNQPGLDLFAGKTGATFEDAEPGMKSLNLLDVALDPARRRVAGHSLPGERGRPLRHRSLAHRGRRHHHLPSGELPRLGGLRRTGPVRPPSSGCHQGGSGAADGAGMLTRLVRFTCVEQSCRWLRKEPVTARQ